MPVSPVVDRPQRAGESRRRPRLPRRDIQGLRAFAVLAVVLDHLLQWPRGGFIGVDVFFVISGFLITGLLVREHERTGHISFVHFYRRRIKRILPAAIVVLVVTVVISYATLISTRAASIRTDAIWALFFSANWRFQAIGTDYFTATAAISPLQHYWSLSIEEQFYFVWPWVMLAVLSALMVRDVTFRTARIVIFGVIALVSVSSFAWAVTATSNDPNGAYFSTFTRTWELGVGAMCAIAAPVLFRIPQALRPALAWVGLVVMTASLFIVSGDTGFPAPWAALPVLATALVIAAGTHEDPTYQQVAFWPLTNPVSNYVGDTSYSLYLWHFPVIVLGEVILGEGTAAKAVLIAVMVGAAVFSFHLIEDPIRRSTIWEITRARREKTGTHYFPYSVRKTYRFYGLAFVVYLAAILGGLALRPVEAPRTIEVSVASDAADDGDTASDGRNRDRPRQPETLAIQEELAAALASDQWPSLTPTMEEAAGGSTAPADVIACSKPGPADLACSWGADDPEHIAVIVGDSMAMTYTNPLRTVLTAEKGWRVYGFAQFGCLFTKTQNENSSAEVVASCPERKATAVRAIQDLEPDLLFVSNLYTNMVPAGSDTRLTATQMADDLLDELDLVAGSVGRIVVLSAPPAGQDPGECYTPGSAPADCVSTVSSIWRERGAAEATAMGQIGGTWIDSSPWFCVEGYCPMFGGNIPVRADVNHMTPRWGERIGPAMEESLQPLLRQIRRGSE